MFCDLNLLLQTSWSEQDRVLREEANMLEKRVQELTKQNTVLHDQMQKVGRSWSCFLTLT